MPTLDLKQLLDNDIITISTYDWFKPLYEKELNDIKEIQEAAQLRKLDPFFTNDNDDDSDDDSDDGLSTMTKTTIHNIEDIESDIQFLTDTNSSGHGNKVWHASIATCRYLKNLLLNDDSDDDADSGTSQSQSLPLPVPFHCLELGAGTALPSLFLSQLLSLLPTDTGTDACIQNKNVTIHITDAKEYRNIKQILMSIELLLLANKKSKSLATATVATETTDTTKCIISYRVSPHNWGDGTDFLNMNNLNSKNELADDESSLLMSSSKSYSNNSNNNIYDLIIISDCIYNPQYHDVLLDSLVSTLKLPTSEQVIEEHDGSNGNGVGNRSNGSGRAVISFSLHGNVDDSNIWNFIKIKIPSRTTKMKTKYHHHSKDIEQDDVNAVVYKLHARCVSTSTATSSSSQDNDNDIDIDIDNDEGWYMKETMTKLGLESDGIDEKRWYAYVYEITWVVVC